MSDGETLHSFLQEGFGQTCCLLFGGAQTWLKVLLQFHSLSFTSVCSLDVGGGGGLTGWHMVKHLNGHTDSTHKCVKKPSSNHQDRQLTACVSSVRCGSIQTKHVCVLGQFKLLRNSWLLPANTGLLSHRGRCAHSPEGIGFPKNVMKFNINSDHFHPVPISPDLH